MKLKKKRDTQNADKYSRLCAHVMHFSTPLLYNNTGETEERLLLIYHIAT